MKQFDITTKEIGEHIFYIKPFPAFTSANISGELAKLLAPIVGSLATLLGGSKEKETKEKDESGSINMLDMNIEDALSAFVEALSGLDGDQIEGMMKKLLITNKNISVEGPVTEGSAKVLTMDLANEIFCGELQDMYILCFEVVKINFGGFFRKLGGQFGSLQEAIQTRTPGMKSGASST